MRNSLRIFFRNRRSNKEKGKMLFTSEYFLQVVRRCLRGLDRTKLKDLNDRNTVGYDVNSTVDELLQNLTAYADHINVSYDERYDAFHVYPLLKNEPARDSISLVRVKYDKFKHIRKYASEIADKTLQDVSKVIGLGIKNDFPRISDKGAGDIWEETLLLYRVYLERMLKRKINPDYEVWDKKK